MIHDQFSSNPRKEKVRNIWLPYSLSKNCNLKYEEKSISENENGWEKEDNFVKSFKCQN